MTTILPQPDSTTAHVHSETGKPTKDFYNWLRSVSDSLTKITGAATTFLLKANNLSDLASASTARTNLGLGTAATLNVGTGANQIVQFTAADKYPAVDGSLITNLTAGEPILTSSTYPVGVALICVNIGATTLANNTTISGASLNNLIAIYTNNCCGTFFGVTVSGVTLPGTWKNVSGISLVGSASGGGTHSAGGQFVRTA